MLLVTAENPQALAVLSNIFVAVAAFSAAGTKFFSNIRSLTFDILA